MKLYSLFKKKVFNIEPGLDRIKKASEELGSPHLQLKSVLIAGTNGKGSTSSYLESLFRHYGFKTALFTSPHLVEENERWQINKTPISDEKLNYYINLINPLIKRYNLTYFEASTLLAFKYFFDQNVDIAILEVGLGGRWDATNIVNPEISIITNVSFDHMHILGDTLDKIAFEKTGITRKNVPAIVGRNQKEIISWLKKRNIHDTYIKDIHFFTEYINSFHFNYIFNKIHIKNLCTHFLGKRQIENIATALTAFLVYSERNNIEINTDLIKTAIENTKIQGRMQILSKEPLIILDGAHNEEALEKSFEELKALFPDKKIITVFSGMKDKQIDKLIKIINENSFFKIATQIPVSRSITKEDLPDNIKFFHYINDAINFAKSIHSDDKIIFITGSLYLAGEVLKIIK